MIRLMIMQSGSSTPDGMVQRGKQVNLVSGQVTRADFNISGGATVTARSPVERPRARPVSSSSPAP